jgi:DNA-binding NarL/FixJ family response regulator
MMAGELRAKVTKRGGERQSPPMNTAARVEPLTVAIIEDQKDIRAGLQILINSWTGFKCTCAYGSVEEALAKLPLDVPKVMLVDIGLPGMSGIHGISVIRERFPNTIALVLTVYNDDERIFEAFCAGASGYLLKNTPPAKLLESLREAVEGGAPMSPEIARRVVNLFQKFRPAQKGEYDLTPHEVRLLQLLAEGHNYKTAAAELGVSINTIGFHMKQIYGKLHVHSKSEAVAKALRNRIVK